jgi:hypothetical protein
MLKINWSPTANQHGFHFFQDLQRLLRRLPGGQRQPQSVMARFGWESGAVYGIAPLFGRDSGNARAWR